MPTELSVTIKSNWKNNPATQDYTKELINEATRYMTLAMNLSVNDKPDIQQILRNLIQAKQIHSIVEKINKL